MAGTRRETRPTGTRRAVGTGRALPVLALLVGLCTACGGDGDSGDPGTAGRTPDAPGAPTADSGDPDDTADDGAGDGEEATGGDGADDIPGLLDPALTDGLWSGPDGEGRTVTVTEGGTTVTYSAGDPPTSCWGRPGAPDEGAVRVDFSCLGSDGSGEGDPVPVERSALLRPAGDELLVEWEDGGTETFVADLP